MTEMAAIAYGKPAVAHASSYAAVEMAQPSGANYEAARASVGARH